MFGDLGLASSPGASLGSLRSRSLSLFPGVLPRCGQPTCLQQFYLNLWSLHPPQTHVHRHLGWAPGACLSFIHSELHSSVAFFFRAFLPESRVQAILALFLSSPHRRKKGCFSKVQTPTIRLSNSSLQEASGEQRERVQVEGLDFERRKDT